MSILGALGEGQRCVFELNELHFQTAEISRFEKPDFIHCEKKSSQLKKAQGQWEKELLEMVTGDQEIQYNFNSY